MRGEEASTFALTGYTEPASWDLSDESLDWDEYDGVDELHHTQFDEEG